METVAPHAGAWIETIDQDVPKGLMHGSHPTRVRGLKRNEDGLLEILDIVAPHAGAWIETPRFCRPLLVVKSRTPRGCVD